MSGLDSLKSTAAGGDSVKTSGATDSVFKPIDGESSVGEVTEIESYCVNCEKNVS